MIRRHLPWAIALTTALLLIITGILDPVHAVLLPAAALALWHAWQALDQGKESRWPAPPTEQRHGGRHDITDLGWAALSRDGRVSARITRRVADLAQHRLAHHGIQLHDPRHRTRADAALGTDVVDGILARRPPTPRTLHHWLDALDQLPPDAPRPGRPPA